MRTSSKRPEKPDWAVPDFDLPVLPEIAGRPPVLSMEQYFLANESDELQFGKQPAFSLSERCLVPFEL